MEASTVPAECSMNGPAGLVSPATRHLCPAGGGLAGAPSSRAPTLSIAGCSPGRTPALKTVAGAAGQARSSVGSQSVWAAMEMPGHRACRAQFGEDISGQILSPDGSVTRSSAVHGASDILGPLGATRDRTTVSKWGYAY